MPHSAIVLRILYPALRKDLIHPQCYLIPGQIVYVVQPEHDPKLTLLDRLYVLFHLQLFLDQVRFHHPKLCLASFHQCTPSVNLNLRESLNLHRAYGFLSFLPAGHRIRNHCPLQLINPFLIFRYAPTQIFDFFFHVSVFTQYALVHLHHLHFLVTGNG